MHARCKRLLWAVLLLAALPALAQNTSITGTVLDPNGLPYASGTILPQLVLVGGASPSVNGFFYIPPNSPSTLSSGGVFSLSLPANASISPAGSQWKFNVCSGAGSIQPAGGKGSVCFNITATISGASQDISTQLQAAAPALAFASGGIPPGSNIATPNISSPTTTGTDSGTETLANKSLTSPAISSPTTTGTDNGTETLGNKSLSSPTVTGILNLPVGNITAHATFAGAVGCTTAVVAGAVCTSASNISWSSTMPDANYRAYCNFQGARTGNAVVATVNNVSASQFTITIVAIIAIASTGNVVCDAWE